MFMTLVVSAAMCAAPRADPRLVGTWLAGNEPFITLAANGTGSMDEGKVKWSTDGAVVTITDETGESDKATFQLEGDTMTLTIGGIPVALRRAGSVKKQSALAEKAARANLGQAGAQQAATAGTDQLSQLLLSSAWCSFSYNKVSGASSKSRVQYFRNGTWSMGGQNETYNSGANGTVAGQYNSNNGGSWEVRNGQLWGSYGNDPLQLVQPFSVTRNSNGSPIINSLGKEYSRCE